MPHSPALRRLRAVAAAALLAARPSAGQGQILELTGGACSYLNFLNGLIFRQQGNTFTGAPWYKADSQEYNNQEYYIYWDPNCAGTFAGTPRWIIDNNKPNVDLPFDLDEDKNCNYQARVDWKTSAQPPSSELWTMTCNFDTAPPEEHRLTFVDRTAAFSTARPTTIAPPQPVLAPGAGPTPRPTPGPVPPAAKDTHEAHDAPVITPAAPTTRAPAGNSTYTGNVSGAMPGSNRSDLLLSGACSEQAYLNGLTFQNQGVTASGAPWYKATNAFVYLFYDPDCSGGGQPARWILDSSMPDVSRKNDLDNDGTCVYLARIDSKNLSVPVSSTWRVSCGTWKSNILSFAAVASYAKVANGTCAAAGKFIITSASICATAAQYLGLPQTVPLAASGFPTPAGCYWDNSSSTLHVSLVDSYNKGNGAMGSRQPICSSSNTAGDTTATALVSAAAGTRRCLLALLPALPFALAALLSACLMLP